MKDALRLALAQYILIKKKDNTVSLPRAKKQTAKQEVVRALLLSAFTGNAQSINTIFDRIDGKIAQPIQGADDPDAPPIQIKDRDMATKEIARVIGFALLEAQRKD